MKKIICLICASLTSAMLLAACGSSRPTGEVSHESLGIEQAKRSQVSAPEESQALPEAIIDSYYAGQAAPAFEYMHHSSIQRFLAMWVKEETGDLENPQWNYDSFTEIDFLDHDFAQMYPGKPIYCLTFSGEGGRYGYAIVEYDEKGPSILNRGIKETTPYQYDLKANLEEIQAALMKTDIDLTTAKASRVYLYDREKKRADQVIRFTDGKGDDYICYYGDAAFETETW